MKVQYCLEIGWKRYNEYLRWWRCLLKQENKNGWYGFVNDGMKIERLNYQVFVKILSTYQELTIFHKALINKSVIDELYPKITNSFWKIPFAVFWYHGSLINTEITRIYYSIRIWTNMDALHHNQVRIKQSGNFHLICSCWIVEIGNGNKTMILTNQTIEHRITIEIMLPW